MQMESKSYVIITFGSYVRFTLENHVIEPYKWKELRNSYVMTYVIITLS